jgi:Ca-activated chloride channel family protein
MTFLSPGRLWLLLIVVALGAVYLTAALSRRRYEVRFTNVALLDVVAPKRPAWRRHLPALAMLCATTALVLGVAQPARDIKVPRERATVVLAIDTSLSMQATDVSPSRIAAAQSAARSFVDGLPRTINLGLVLFDGIARLAVTPTTDRAPVLAAIDSMQLAERTAIGEAIFASLDAIAAVPPPEDGVEVPSAIVVMSDGKTTYGRPNEAAADAAAEAAIPVSTIAFGTPYGEILDPTEGLSIPVPVEPEPLRQIAEATEGQFFEAETLDQLEDVYTDIGSAVGFETEQREITVAFTAVALGLVLVTAAMSLLWFQRLP